MNGTGALRRPRAFPLVEHLLCTARTPPAWPEMDDVPDAQLSTRHAPRAVAACCAPTPSADFNNDGVADPSLCITDAKNYLLTSLLTAVFASHVQTNGMSQGVLWDSATMDTLVRGAGRWVGGGAVPAFAALVCCDAQRSRRGPPPRPEGVAWAARTQAHT